MIESAKIGRGERERDCGGEREIQGKKETESGDKEENKDTVN